MTARNFKNCLLLFFFCLGFLGYPAKLLAGEMVEVGGLVMAFELERPRLYFYLKNRSGEERMVMGRMVVKDRLTGREVEAYQGGLIDLAAGEGEYLSLDWEEPWKGFGLPEVRLEVWEENNPNDRMVAKTGFVLAPSLVTTLSLASLLLIGGKGGMSLISKLA